MSPASTCSPFAPSVSARNAFFRKRIAVGLWRRISRAHCTPSASSCSSGTTAFTSPICSASCASYCRQRYQISRAFFSPTLRASIDEPKPASNDPTRGPVWPKRALSAAIVRSQITCSTCPPPIAHPATSAITGFGISRMKRCSGSTLRLGDPSSSR